MRGRLRFIIARTAKFLPHEQFVLEFYYRLKFYAAVRDLNFTVTTRARLRLARPNLLSVSLPMAVKFRSKINRLVRQPLFAAFCDEHVKFCFAKRAYDDIFRVDKFVFIFWQILDEIFIFQRR